MRLALLIAATLLLSACGSSGDTPDPAVLVREVPLTLAEMPSGWRETPDGDDLASQVKISPACDVFNLAILFPDALATAQSRSHQGPLKQQAQSFAAVYPSEADAQRVIEGTDEIIDRCGDEFKDTLKGAAEDQLDALGLSLGFFAKVDVSLEVHNDPPLGDGSAGYRVQVRVSAAGSGQSFTVDYRVFHEGNVVAASQYAAFGDVDAEEELTIALSLLASAAGATPAA